MHLSDFVTGGRELCGTEMSGGPMLCPSPEGKKASQNRYKDNLPSLLYTTGQVRKNVPELSILLLATYGDHSVTSNPIK